MGLKRVRAFEPDDDLIEVVPGGSIQRRQRTTPRIRAEETIGEILTKDRTDTAAPPEEQSGQNRSIWGMRPDIFARCMMAFDLRLDGYSYAQIAKRIYPSEPASAQRIKNVGRDVSKAMKVMAKILEDDFEHARDVEVQRLDRLYLRIAKYAHGFEDRIELTDKELKTYKAKRYKYAAEEIDQENSQLIRRFAPDMRAAETLIQLSKRRSELLGLDAPKKVQVGEDPDFPFNKKDESDLFQVLQAMVSQIPDGAACKLGIKKSVEREQVELEVTSDGMVNLPPQTPSLRRVGFNEETDVMTIQTRAGKFIEFIGVPEDLFLQFVESRSPSTFYLKNIKGKFESQSVGEVKGG